MVTIQEFKTGTFKAFSERNKSILIAHSNRDEWYRVSDAVLTYILNNKENLQNVKVRIGITDKIVMYIREDNKETKEETKGIVNKFNDEDRQRLIVAQSSQHDAVELVKELIKKTDLKNIENIVELVILARDKLMEDLLKKYRKWYIK